jgi:hypothetical protein
MQLYLAIGLPVFAFLVNIAAGIVQTTSLHARIASVENNMNARFASMETNINVRFASVESRIASLEWRFDTLIGKVIEIDKRR